MPEPEIPDGDHNVQVRCVACHSDYVTSNSEFECRGCRCPGCGGSRAQLLDVFADE